MTTTCVCPICHGTGQVLLSWGREDCPMCDTSGRVTQPEPELVPWAMEHPEDSIKPRAEAMDPRLRVLRTHR